MDTIFKPIKLAGTELSKTHVSVNLHSKADKVYEAIHQAIKNNPEREPDLRDIERMKALQLAFDRIKYLSLRHQTNFQVSRGDHARMIKEYNHLKNKVQLLSSDHLYETPIILSSNENYIASEEQTADILKYRTNQVMQGIWRGEYSQSRDNSIENLQIARAKKLDRYVGDPKVDMQLVMKGPIGIFSRGTKIEFTAKDFSTELDSVPFSTEENDDDGIAWAQKVTSIVRDRIVNNPAQALASQVDGYEKSGRVFFQLLRNEPKHGS